MKANTKLGSEGRQMKVENISAMKVDRKQQTM